MALSKPERAGAGMPVGLVPSKKSDRNPISIGCSKTISLTTRLRGSFFEMGSLNMHLKPDNLQLSMFWKWPRVKAGD